MVTVVPIETMAGAWEMACYAFTVVAVVISYVLQYR